MSLYGIMTLMNNLMNFWVQIPWLVKALSADLFVVLVALLGGKLISYLSLEKMKELRINDYFRAHLETTGRDDDSEKGASEFIALFLTTNVWILGLAGIFLIHQQPEWMGALLEILRGFWKVAFVALFAAFGGTTLSRGAMGIIRSPFIRSRLDAMTGNPDSRAESFADTLAKGLGTMIFAIACLLVFLTFTEVYHLTLLNTTITALWSLALRLFSASAALCVGGLGVLFLLNTRESAPDAENKAPSLDLQARIGIILVTTLFAVDLIASAIGAVFWVALILLVGIFLVPLKERLFHIWAGFSLEFHHVKDVTLDGKKVTLEKVGILYTEVRFPDGRTDFLPNHDLLAAYKPRED